MPNNTITLRLATQEDITTIFKLLEAFAKHQGVYNTFHLTLSRLEHLMTRHGLRVLLACDSNAVIGAITFYETISTFSGEMGLYIEDMYIHQDYQRQGVGKVLLDGMIEQTRELGYTKLEWQCLNDNHGAIAFYEKMGAIKDEHWKTFRYTI